MVNIMAADGLAMQGAKASAAMVFIHFGLNILVSAPDELTYCPQMTQQALAYCLLAEVAITQKPRLC